MGAALGILGCAGSASTNTPDAMTADVVAADRPDVTMTDATDAVATDVVAADLVALDAPDAGGAPGDVGSDVGNDVPAAQGFTAPLRQWTWVPVDGAVCGDGSPTGVGVNLAPSPEGVLVVLSGGGACWDEQTCFVLNTALRGPFGGAQLAQAVPGLGGTILDRDRAGSPFANWSMVFVPYCTGDLFLGTREASFGAGGPSRTWQFRGRSNLQAVLPRVAATEGAATAVALLGLSSGGVGAVHNHALLRELAPRGRAFVIADSGILLDTGAAARTLRETWYPTWGAGWVDARCADCRANPLAIFAANAGAFTADRTAVINSRQDTVQRTLVGATAMDYEAALRAGVGALPAAHRAFVVDGNGHVFATRTAAVTAGDGAALLPWIGEMLAGGAWSSHGL